LAWRFRRLKKRGIRQKKGVALSIKKLETKGRVGEKGERKKKAKIS